MLQALNLPKKVYFKPGCMPVALRELGDIYRCQRALLVTDPELYRAGIAAPVADRLRKQEIRVAEFFTIGKRVSFAESNKRHARRATLRRPLWQTRQTGKR